MWYHVDWPVLLPAAELPPATSPQQVTSYFGHCFYRAAARSIPPRGVSAPKESVRTHETVRQQLNAVGSSTSRPTKRQYLLYVPTRRLVSGRTTRIPSGVDIGDGAARLRASRVRPFTRAARAPAAAASCVVSSPHELLHPGRLLLLGPPVLHRVLRGLLEVRRVDDDLRAIGNGREFGFVRRVARGCSNVDAPCIRLCRLYRG